MNPPPYPGPPNSSSYSFPTSQEPFSTAPFANIPGHLPLQYQHHQRYPQHQQQHAQPTRVQVQALKRPGVYQDTSRYVEERVDMVGAGEGSREDGAKSRFSRGYYGDHPAVWASRTPGSTFNPDPTPASSLDANQNVNMRMYRTHARQTMQTQAYPQPAHSGPRPRPVFVPHHAPSQPLTVATSFAEWARNLPSPPPWTRQGGAIGTKSSEPGDVSREDERWTHANGNGNGNANVDAHVITKARVPAEVQVDIRQGPARREAGSDVPPEYYALPGDPSTHSVLHSTALRAGTRISTPAPALDLLAQISTSTLPGYSNLLSSQPLPIQTSSAILCRCGSRSGSNPCSASTCTCLSEQAGASASTGLMTTAPHPSVHLIHGSVSTPGHTQDQLQMQMQTRPPMKSQSSFNTQFNLVGWNDMDVSTSVTVARPSMIEMESAFRGGSAQSQSQSSPSVESMQVTAAEMASGMGMGMGKVIELNISSSPDAESNTAPSAEVNIVIDASSQAEKCLDPFPHGLYGVKSWKSNGSDCQRSDQVRTGKDALSGIDETFLVGSGHEPVGVEQISLQRSEPARDKGRSRAKRSASSMSLNADIGWPGEEGLSAPIPSYQLDDLFQEESHDWQRQSYSLGTGTGIGKPMHLTNASTPGYDSGQSTMVTPAASCSGTSALSGWKQNPDGSNSSQKWDDAAMVYQLDMIKASRGKGEKVSFADLSAAYIHQRSGTMQTTLAGSSVSTPSLASRDPPRSSSIPAVGNEPLSMTAGVEYWPGQGLADYGSYAPSTSHFSEHGPTLTDGSSVDTSWSCSTPWGVGNTDALVFQAAPSDVDFDLYSSKFLDTSKMVETDDGEDVVLTEFDASRLATSVGTPMMLYGGVDAIEDVSFSHELAVGGAGSADVVALYGSKESTPNAPLTGQSEDKTLSNISGSSPAVAVNHNKRGGHVAPNSTVSSGVITGKALECENCKSTTTALWGKGPADEVLCSLCSVASQLEGKRRNGKSRELQSENKALEEESGSSVEIPLPSTTRLGDSALDDSPFDGAICEYQQEPLAGTTSSRQVTSKAPKPSSSKFLVTTTNTGRPARIGQRRTTQPSGAGKQSHRGTDDPSQNIVQPTPELVSSFTTTACDQLALAPEPKHVTKDSPITTRTRAKRTLPDDTTPSDKPIAPPKKQRKKKATKPKK